MVLLDLMSQGKRILNLDQSPIVECQGLQKGWCPKGEGGYVSGHIVWPRVTMMLAIDSYGNIFYSLLQANANDDTMRLFLYRLIEKLDKQDPQWRKDTVL